MKTLEELTTAVAKILEKHHYFVNEDGSLLDEVDAQTLDSLKSYNDFIEVTSIIEKELAELHLTIVFDNSDFEGQKNTGNDIFGYLIECIKKKIAETTGEFLLPSV